MTQYVINIGAIPNDGTGDPLRTAFNETNLNFDQVFAAGPVLSNVQIANNTILTTNTNGNLVLAPNGIGVVQANVSIVPNSANIRNLGSADRRWSTIYLQYANISGGLTVTNLTATGNVVIGGNLSVTGNIINVANIITDAKTIQLANTAGTANAADGSGITVGANDSIATFLFNSANTAWATNIGLAVGGPITGISLAVSDATIYGNLNGIDGYFTGTVTSPNIVVNNISSDDSTFVTIADGINVQGDITASTLSVTGNITGNYFIGNGSQLTGLYANANAVAYGQAGWTGNIVPAISNTYSLGNSTNWWSNIWVAGNTIYIGGVALGMTAGNVLTVGGNAVLQNDSNTTISTTGNITADYFFGNGSQLTGLNTSSISNGTSNVEIATANGNITVTANGSSTWTFDTTGNLVTPGNLVIGPSPAGGTSMLQPDSNLQVVGEGANAFVVAGWAANTNAPDSIAVVAFNSPYNSGASNVLIAVGNNATTVNYWTFANNGTTTFPTLTVDLHNGGNQAGQVLQFGDDSQQAIITGPTPEEDNNAERLIIQGQRGNGTGEGGDVYLWGGDAEFNGGDIKIYAGDADNVASGSGGYVNIEGGSGFDSGGYASLRGGQTNNGQGAYAQVVGGYGVSGGDANITGGQGYAGVGGNVNITGGISGNGLAEYGNVNITAGASTWTFDNTGNLNLQGTSVISEVSNPAGFPGVALSLAADITNRIDADQQLLIYPTGGVDANHLHITSGNLYNTELFLGNDNLYVKLANTGNIIINSNDNVGNSAQWIFGTDATLYAPGAVSATGNIIGNYFIGDGSLLTGLPASYGDANVATFLAAYGSNTVSTTGNITAGNFVGAGSNVDVVAGSYDWTFDNTGNLTLPGNTFAVNYANGTQVSLGGNYGNSNVANFLAAYGSNTISTTGNITAGVISATAINLSSTGTAVNAGSGNILTNRVTGTQFAFLNGIYTAVLTGAGATANYTLNLPSNVGSNGQSLTSDGTGNLVWTTPASSYGNANVSTFLAAFGSNTISTTGNVTAANFIGNIEITGNISGTSANVELVAGVYEWTFDNTGNLTLPGNTFAVNYANGTVVSLGGGSYGNANVATFLASYGSNTVSTTGNITSGNLSVSGNITGNISFTGANVILNNNTGLGGTDEGGELHFSVGAANTTLTGPIAIDIYQNRMRFFDTSSPNKGAYIDLANCANSAGTNLVNRASIIAGANTAVTLDNLQARVGGSPTRLYINTVSGNLTGAGTTQTMLSGSIAVSSWINVPIGQGAANAFAMSGAISSNGDTAVLNLIDQDSGIGMWRITGMIANTSANLYGVTIERLV